MSADQGRVSGQVNCGVLRYEDLNVPTDHVEVAEYFKFAADAEDNYGELYHESICLKGKVLK
jgi:hypothetical protein